MFYLPKHACKSHGTKGFIYKQYCTRFSKHSARALQTTACSQCPKRSIPLMHERGLWTPQRQPSSLHLQGALKWSVHPSGWMTTEFWGRKREPSEVQNDLIKCVQSSFETCLNFWLVQCFWNLPVHGLESWSLQAWSEAPRRKSNVHNVVF